MDKKELVDAVIEMIKQDTAAGDLDNVDRIINCAFKEKLKVCLPDYEEEYLEGLDLDQEKQGYDTEKGDVGPAMGAEAQAAFERMTAYEEHSQYQQQPMTEEELIAKLNAEGEDE
jgi:hypothetical protein